MTDDDKSIDEEAARRFEEDLVRRGEAAKPDDAGKLPPGATHEIVEGEDGEPEKIVRRRFTIS